MVKVQVTKIEKGDLGDVVVEGVVKEFAGMEESDYKGLESLHMGNYCLLTEEELKGLTLE